MYTEMFLEHFSSLVRGPDGVHKLRELVLNLAISGRLSDRRREDGHAAELIESARSSVSAAIKSGEIRKPKYFERKAVGEPEGQLPPNWVLSTLGDLGLISPRNDAPDDTVVGFVPMAAIEAKYGLQHSFEERRWADIKSGYTHVANGDVVLAKITPCFENGKSAAIAQLPGGIGAGTTELHVFRQLVPVVEPGYLLAFLKSGSFIQAGIPKMTGTAGQKRIPADYFALSPLPLPPLAEQKRIVAKIDELMALCDQLETQVRNDERLAAELMASLVHALTETDPDGGGSMAKPAGLREATIVFTAPDTASDDLGEPSGSTSVSALGTSEATGRAVPVAASDVDTRFKEAVLVGAIVKAFFDVGGEPIGNFRLQKAVYFARRHNGEHVGEMDYLKKAAGPYNPSMKYSGGIAIAKQKSWLLEARGRFGFGHVPGPTASEMDDWIARYGYDESARWVAEHFRFKKNEEWETLATIDYAMEHLQSVGIEPDGAHILQYIRSDDEWRPKIEKLKLTEMSVGTAMLEVKALFSAEGEDDSV